MDLEHITAPFVAMNYSDPIQNSAAVVVGQASLKRADQAHAITMKIILMECIELKYCAAVVIHTWGIFSMMARRLPEKDTA